jgi:hypothetical protein
MYNFYRGKSSPQTWVISVIFIKLPKVNNYLIGEISPNLFTLTVTKTPIGPRRRGEVDIASASGTRRPGFESRQGIKFLGKHSSAVVYKMT